MICGSLPNSYQQQECMQPATSINDRTGCNYSLRLQKQYTKQVLQAFLPQELYEFYAIKSENL